MQVNQGQDGSFKSFGIPPHMRPAVEAAEKSRREGSPSVEQPQSMPKAVVDSTYTPTIPGEIPENTVEANLQPEAVTIKDPVQSLKDEFDVEITSEDIQRIIFKGYTEKDVVVLSSVMGSDPLVATFKTLTGKEYEEADEKLAEEIRDSRMTNDGFVARRGLWLLAYGLKKIQGKAYYQAKYLDEAKKTIDRKATLEARKNALNNFSPIVLSKMMEIQSSMTIAINYIFSNKGDAVKKP